MIFFFKFTQNAIITLVFHKDRVAYPCDIHLSELEPRAEYPGKSKGFYSPFSAAYRMGQNQPAHPSQCFS
jgi:hypothetical protein